MKTKAICLSNILFFLFLLSCQQESKPNFVFILVDDLGWTDLGCYGSDYYQTPFIDELASDGVRFTDAYAACPVCSPTRASILTGKYPARLNFTRHIPAEKRSYELEGRGKILSPPEVLRQLPPREITIAETLKENGYTTAMIGKWHLGEIDEESYQPQNQGFDFKVLSQQHGYFNYFFPFVDTLAFPWSGPFPGIHGDYLPDNLTNEALGFIERNAKQPFFLYLSHWSVHISNDKSDPLEAKKEMITKYESLKDTSKNHHNPRYAAMVESVDESLGRIIKKLKELGLYEKTVIIFSSDNGGVETSAWVPDGITLNDPLRGEKASLYEGGIRVPLIIRSPNTSFAGKISDEPVISTDYFPTILELAGIPLNPGQHKDGISLKPFLVGKKDPVNRSLYWHYPHYQRPGVTYPSAAMRQGNYKLIEFYEDGHLELYNLVNDIGESDNLANEMPEKTAELYSILCTWRESVNAQMPIKNKPE